MQPNRIHNLRRRLEHYYEVENPHDPVHIELPKGSYCPVFQRPSVTLPSEPALEIAQPAPAGYRVDPEFWSRSVPLRTVCLICAIAVVTAAGVVSELLKDGPGLDPALAEAWGPLLA